MSTIVKLNLDGGDEMEDVDDVRSSCGAAVSWAMRWNREILREDEPAFTARIRDIWTCYEAPMTGRRCDKLDKWISSTQEQYPDRQ